MIGRFLILLFFVCSSFLSSAQKVTNEIRKLEKDYADSCGIAFQKKNTQVVILYAHKMLDLAKSVNDHKYIGIAHATLAVHYYMENDIDSFKVSYKNALKYFLLAEKELAVTPQNANELIDIYTRIIMFHENFWADQETMFKYAKKAQKMLPYSKNHFVTINFHNSFGRLLLNSQQIDSAKQHVEKAIEIAIKNNRKYEELQSKNTLAIILSMIGKVEDSNDLLRNIITESVHYKYYYYGFMAKCNLSVNYQTQGKHKEALALVDSCLNSSFCAKDKKTHLGLLNNKIGLLLDLKNYENIKEIFIRSLVMSDSLDQLADVHKLIEAKKSLENEQLQEENQIKQLQIKSQKNTQYLSCLEISVIILYLLIYVIPAPRKKDKLPKLFIKAIGVSVLISISVYVLSSLSYFKDYVDMRRLLIGLTFIYLVFLLLLSFFKVLFINEKKLNEDWNIKQDLIFHSAAILILITTNVVYTILLNGMIYSSSALISYYLLTLSVGILLLTCILYYKRNEQLQHHLKQALLINKELEVLQMRAQPQNQGTIPFNETQTIENDLFTIVGDNVNEKITLTQQQFMYIESSNNYCTIIYVDDEKEKKRLIIRSSLKRIEDQIPLKIITRCHRSFIVNLLKVKEIEGNSNGYKISFSLIEDQIPVSRAYGEKILNELKNK